MLRFYEGRNLREVGAALGANEEAARKRVNRAVEKLQKFFQKHGVGSTAEAIAGVISTNSVQAAPAMLAKSVTTMALAKSAAVSTSTLTLIKGALKLMAWTKTKTAVAVAVVAVLGTGTTLLTAKALHASRVARLNVLHDIQGVWEGNIATGGAGIDRGESFRNRMILKITRSNGDYAAAADFIDLGRTDLPVAVDYAYPSLRLIVNPQVIMDGKVNADATRLGFRGFALLRTNLPDMVPGELAQDAFAPRAGSDLQGYWKGTIGVQPDPLPLNWRIAGRADGTFRAELDNPNQGALGQPATVIYRRPTVQLILTSRNGMFQGEINGENTEINGSWIQAGQATPASLTRSDYAADHAQDSFKDYSFHSDNDLQGHWEGGFLLREKPVKFPIVLDLDIAKLPDGTFSATGASIYDLGNDGPRPASAFEYNAPNLTIAWKWMNDRLEGKLKNGKIVGAWINGNNKWHVVFERKRK